MSMDPSVYIPYEPDRSYYKVVFENWCFISVRVSATEKTDRFYCCGHCPTNFTERRSLVRHMRARHMPDIISDEEQITVGRHLQEEYRRIPEIDLMDIGETISRRDFSTAMLLRWQPSPTQARILRRTVEEMEPLVVGRQGEELARGIDNVVHFEHEDGVEPLRSPFFTPSTSGSLLRRLMKLVFGFLLISTFYWCIQS